MIDKKTKTYILLGVIAALFWSIADVLLVGFIPQVDTYKIFTEVLFDKSSSQLAILMMDGSPLRLMWGVYLATFSVFFYLLSLFGIYYLFPKNNLNKFALFALFIGYTTSPVGHAGFAYIGLLSQSIYNTDINAISAQIKLFHQFKELLNIHWIISVSFSVFGWFFIFIQILIGKTKFNRRICLITPIVTAPLLAYVSSFFPENKIAVIFGCASLNISQLLFFSYLFIILHKKEDFVFYKLNKKS